MSEFPAYDEVHVISDIHMGGKPGFQILRETQRLANYIRWVAAQRPEGRVALILNGDVFDTLAEDIRGYVAVDEATATLTRIMDDNSFSGIWEALADFVKKKGRTLVIVIGNHDIEVSFPSVQRLILSRLAGEDLLARARIEFSTTGAGHTCLVGNARVFCTHGNEVDAWNYNRYEDLAKVARRLNAGRSLEPSEWYPNAGTRMVKEVMNEVKRRYAWIDLLKPETSAAVGIRPRRPRSIACCRSSANANGAADRWTSACRRKDSSPARRPARPPSRSISCWGRTFRPASRAEARPAHKPPTTCCWPPRRASSNPALARHPRTKLWVPAA
ncbi:MAG: metallophosphoesterase [Methylocaldum sp.]|nr:metallophosphoesterase [Methylocaldum sp.]